MRKEKLVQEKNKVEGAYILIEDLKKQLRMFDKALEKLYKEKAGKDELEILKQSVNG